MTSVETDTVALPIDVAVISKGDGFIWIKRKHYFEPALNQHFFSNYYRKDEASRNDKPKLEQKEQKPVKRFKTQKNSAESITRSQPSKKFSGKRRRG